jgi:monofunctional biosynthetic peptidoglycan transglycosylase
MLTASLFVFANSTQDWRIVNDGVMGGRSTAQLTKASDHLLWTGRISLENNGGFSSVRSPQGNYDLSESEGISFRFRGDGRRYALNLKTTRGFSPVSYQFYFQTVAGEWMDIEVPFEDMMGTYFAEPAKVAPLDPAQIKEIGFLLYDKKAGPFEASMAEVGTF